MLSVAPIGAGKGASATAKYYEDLAREDYYEHGGEPPGRYMGAGCEAYGIEAGAKVEDGELLALMRGYHPKTGEVIAKNAGENHKPGWDLTFSAPKSVSAIWAGAADAQLRRAISEAHARAVARALAYVEQNAVKTRDGRTWTGGVVAAVYEHSTSRNQDPELHSHALMQNFHPEGGGLDFDTRHKMAVGAVYRTELAADMQKLGFKVERDSTCFRIVGVPGELEKYWSTRRQEIEAALAERGVSGGKAAAVAALDTRQAKAEISRSELFNRWEREAREHGLDMEAGRDVPRQRREAMPSHAELMAELTDKESSVSEYKLRTAVFQAAQGRFNAAQAQAYLDELKASQAVEILRDARGSARYSTPDMVATEARVLKRAQEMAVDHSQAARAATVDAEIKKRTLTEQQERAVWHMTQGGRVAIVQGMAGTGKSYALETAKDIWEKEGYQVRGVALQGKAAEGIVQSSGIESATIHSTLHQIEHGKIKLDAKTVLVVDEAGMVDSRLMDKLQGEADRAGAKIVYVGDRNQLASVQAGGGFAALQEKLEAVELDEIVRQKHVDNDASRRHNEQAREAMRQAGALRGKDVAFKTDNGTRQIAEGERMTFTGTDKAAGLRAGQTGTVERAEPGRLVVKTDDGKRVEVAQAKYDKIDYAYAVEAERAMVKDFAAGRAGKAIDHLDAQGRTTTYKNAKEAQAGVARAVVADMQEGKTSIALVGTNKERVAVNEQARAAMRQAGALRGQDAPFKTEQARRQFSDGDRVMFLENNKQLGVMNGTTGMVERAEPGRLVVKIDDGKRVEVDQAQYAKIDHGYAYTVHKAQGITVDRAHMIPGKAISRESAYVGMSRHREHAVMHGTKTQIQHARDTMQRSSAKVSTATMQPLDKRGELNRQRGEREAHQNQAQRVNARAMAQHNPCGLEKRAAKQGQAFEQFMDELKKQRDRERTPPELQQEQGLEMSLELTGPSMFAEAGQGKASGAGARGAGGDGR